MMGKANTKTLADAMKEIEEVTTSTTLVPNIPVYARLDGRCFHTFCRGLDKPFDKCFMELMRETTQYLHSKTGAVISYVQSDEISLGFLTPTAMPFERRLFKLQSVFAGMASSYFCINGLTTKLKEKIERQCPHFDCRVCQMSLEDMTKMFLFRANDCLKNSVSMVAQANFSHKRLQNANTNDRKRMLLEEKGIDYDRDFSEQYRYGSYFRKVSEMKRLTDEELERIPPDKRPESGLVQRNLVSEITFGLPLSRIANGRDVLFNGAEPIDIFTTENPGTPG